MLKRISVLFLLLALPAAAAAYFLNSGDEYEVLYKNAAFFKQKRFNTLELAKEYRTDLVYDAALATGMEEIRASGWMVRRNDGSIVQAYLRMPGIGNLFMADRGSFTKISFQDRGFYKKMSEYRNAANYIPQGPAKTSWEGMPPLPEAALLSLKDRGVLEVTTTSDIAGILGAKTLAELLALPWWPAGQAIKFSFDGHIRQ